MTYEEISAEIRLPAWFQDGEVYPPDAWVNCFGAFDEWVLRPDPDGKYRPWDDEGEGVEEFATAQEAMAAIDEDQRRKIMGEHFPHLVRSNEPPQHEDGQSAG